VDKQYNQFGRDKDSQAFSLFGYLGVAQADKTSTAAAFFRNV
jgi:hypothetical protein